MVLIIIVATDNDVRETITAAMPESIGEIVTLDDRSKVSSLLCQKWQLMIYAVRHRDDLDWLTAMMSLHPELRVLFLSQMPWASLPYDRARCMVAPSKAISLQVGTFTELVKQLLPAQVPRGQRSKRKSSSSTT